MLRGEKINSDFLYNHYNNKHLKIFEFFKFSFYIFLFICDPNCHVHTFNSKPKAEINYKQVPAVEKVKTQKEVRQKKKDEIKHKAMDKYAEMPDPLPIEEEEEEHQQQSPASPTIVALETQLFGTQLPTIDSLDSLEKTPPITPQSSPSNHRTKWTRSPSRSRSRSRSRSMRSIPTLKPIITPEKEEQQAIDEARLKRMKRSQLKTILNNKRLSKSQWSRRKNKRKNKNVNGKKRKRSQSQSNSKQPSTKKRRHNPTNDESQFIGSDSEEDSDSIDNGEIVEDGSGDIEIEEDESGGIEEVKFEPKPGEVTNKWTSDPNCEFKICVTINDSLRKIIDDVTGPQNVCEMALIEQYNEWAVSEGWDKVTKRKTKANFIHVFWFCVCCICLDSDCDWGCVNCHRWYHTKCFKKITNWQCQCFNS